MLKVDKQTTKVHVSHAELVVKCKSGCGVFSMFVSFVISFSHSFGHFTLNIFPFHLQMPIVAFAPRYNSVRYMPACYLFFDLFCLPLILLTYIGAHAK